MTDEEMAHYSAALDEIYQLRSALAYEAGVTEVHLSYKTFPKTRRSAACAQVGRMRDAAIGHGRHAYGGVHPASLRIARHDAGMGGLTRWQWENERAGAPETTADTTELTVTLPTNATTTSEEQ